jgi:hypothetical protein
MGAGGEEEHSLDNFEPGNEHFEPGESRHFYLVEVDSEEPRRSEPAEPQQFGSVVLD